MATLTLNRIWINLLPSGEGISGASNRGKGHEMKVQLTVRTYANGRRRAFTTRGEEGTVPITLVALDYATKELLRTWIGRTVQVRDTRGQKWFGTFDGISVSEYMRPDLYAVSFTLQLTTTTEGV